MKRFYLFLVAMTISLASMAQPLTGTKNIPGDYATIGAAVTALNTNGVGTGGVTFVFGSAGSPYSESITVPVLITATGTVSNPIIFKGFDLSNPATITRTDAGTVGTTTVGGQGDAVIIIQGGDYITFNYMNVAATQGTVEYGYYFRKASVTDGCKNVTIQNCTIDMTKGSTAYVMGIYVSNNDAASLVSSQAGVTVTSEGGRHENIVIKKNIIQDVHTGIYVRGYGHTSAPYNFLDQNIVIGTNDNGNIIRNYGGGSSTTAYGVYLIYQTSPSVNYNTIDNAGNGGVNATGTLYGIYMTTSGAAGNFAANNNTLTLSQGSASALYGIYNSITCTSSQYNNNTFAFGSNDASTTSDYLIYASSATNNVTVSNNKTSGTLTKTSGSLYGYYNSGSPTGGTETITSNNFSYMTVSAGTTSTYLAGIYSNTSTTQARVCSNNIITNLTHSGTGYVYPLYVLSGLTNQVNDNTVYDITGGYTLYGLYFSGTTPTVYNNTVYNLTTTGATLYGIYDAGTGTTNCYKNKVYNIQGTATVAGIYISTGTSNNVYNNYISDIKAPASVSPDGLRGIYVGGTSTAFINLYFNTVYMEASSTGGVDFGSSAVYAVIASNLDMRNNILVNNSTPSGAGKTVAYRRSGIDLSTYVSTSDANCFYAGSVEDATHAIFYDGTTVKDLSTYKTDASPRDGGSFNAVPPFVNNSTTPYDLHLIANSQTGCESGGVTVTGIDTDYDGDPRFGNSSYVGSGTMVDIGADEFAGLASFTCSPPNPGQTLATANPVCLNQSVTLSLTNETTGTGVSYQWQSSVNGSSYTDIAGATLATYTFTATDELWYQCVVNCQNGSQGTSVALKITFANKVSGTTPNSVCGAGTVYLEATISGSGSPAWYDVPSGGVALGTNVGFTTPVITATTTYYVAEESYIPASLTVGTGTTYTTGATTPFYGGSYGGNKHQYLVTAAELSAAGLIAGNISAITWDIGATNGSTYQGFSISMANTTLTDLVTTAWEGGLTSVFATTPPAGVIPAVGPFTVTFDTPWYWDGTSNIIIQTCWSDNSAGTAGTASVKYTSAVGFYGTHYYYVDNNDQPTVCSSTAAGTRSTSRPIMTFTGLTVCSSPRVPVVASVTPAPVVTLTADQTICNNTVANISVTSTLGNYNSYTWSPITHLFTDAACTVPFTGGSATSLYFKNGTAGAYTYTCTANNSVSGCGYIATTTITNLPAAISIATPQSTYCLTGSPVLSVTPATGYGAATLQWQSSTDNVNFSDISGANAITYTPAVTATTYYKLLVKVGSTVCLSSNVLTITVNSPQVTGTTPGSRCGIGTVTLGATGNPGSTLNWYSASTGGVSLGSGTSFNTPVISLTTSYYVDATIGLGNVAVGLTPTTTTCGTMATSSATDWPIRFNTLGSATIVSVDVIPYAAGTFTVALRNSLSSTDIQTADFTFVTGDVGVPKTLPLGFTVSAAGSYQLTNKVGGITRIGTFTCTYPFTSPSGNFSIVGSATTSTSTTNTTTYNSFYNIVVQEGCISARTEVIATVTPAPALTLTPNQTICNNNVATLSVTSNLADYNTYIWSPITNLFTDLACTQPYTGSSATTLYYKSLTGGATTYTVNSTSPTCTNVATTEVINLPAIPVINAVPEQLCITGTSTMTLSPATGWGAATFQWQNSTDGISYSDITGATTQNYTTPTLTSTTYYKLKISSGANLCSEPIKTIIVNNPQITGTTPGSRCGTGTVTLGATSNGSTISWYDTPSGGTAIGTGSPFVTPVISSTTSYWVGAGSGASSVYVGMIPTIFGTSGSGTTTYGLKFDALAPFTLTSVDIYAHSTTSTPGSVVVSVINTSGTVLHTANVNVNGYDQTIALVPQTISLNFNIQPEMGLRLVMTSKTGITGLMFQPSAQSPYPFPYTLPGVVSILCGTYSGADHPELYYYYYNWRISTGCSSALQEVIATVTPPLDLTVSANQTVCNNSVATLQVTSTLSNFDSYVWSPTTDLFTNPACTIPYTGSSASTVYYKSTTAGAVTYTCTANNSVSLCQNIATTNVTNLPGSFTLTATPPELCLSGETYLAPSLINGWTGATFQWQSSPDGINYTDIPGGINIDYTPTLSSTTHFKLQIKLGTDVCTSSTIIVTVQSPQISGTTPATRCGTGTVQLGATGSGGTINWYESSTSSTILGTGTLFTTPVISTTATYYVASDVGAPPATIAVGAGASTSATYSNPFYSLYSNSHTQYMIKASELTAAGITTGNLTSVALDITSAGSLPMIDFSLKIGTTAATDMTSFVGTALTQVYSNASLLPVVGLNVLPFNSPFYWDGVSNIVLEFCHGNAASTATMSRTCKTDATSYVAAIKTHVTTSPGTSGAVICGNTTSNVATYSVRPQFTFGTYPGCHSPRVAVIATVTPAPDLTLSANQTVCNNNVGTLQVTSTLSNFDSYIWSPTTDLFTNLACTTPYTGTSASTVYYKSTTNGVHTYTCNATNTVSGCANMASTVIYNLPVAPALTAEAICYSGSTTVKLVQTSGYGSATYQWADSPDGITYTDITGAVNQEYLTPVLSASRYYKLKISVGGNQCTESVYQVIVDNPQIAGTTPGSRCGVGTVQLGAAYSGGTLNWYETSTSPTVLGTGSSFTTPIISTTTTYYAQCQSAGSTTAAVGAPYNGATGTYTLQAGLLFDVFSTMTLQGVYVYPIGTGPGVVNVALKTNSGTVLQSLAFNTTGTASPGIKTFIPLNWIITPGTQYWLDMPSYSGSITGLIRDGTADIVGGAIATNPNMTIPGVVTITSGRLTASGTSTSYYYFYDWRVSVGCATSRIPVVATVTNPPNLTVTADQTICNNTVATLAVLSNVPDFDSYIWSPATNLFTDAACTVAYTGNSASTVYFKSATGLSQQYTCTATNSVSQCVNVATTTVSNLPANPVLASTGDICVSGSVVLSATPATGWGAATFQWQDSPDGNTYTDISGATALTYTTPTLTSTRYYKLKVLVGGNPCSESTITVVMHNPLVTGITPSTQCGFGQATLGATGTGGTLNWFTAASGGNPVGTGTSYTTPIIATTTNYYVECVSGFGPSASVGPATNGIGTNAYFTSTLYYTNFNVLASVMKLKGVYVYPETAGTVKLYIADNNGNVLHTVDYAVTTPGVKTYVPINYDIVGGTGYRIGPRAGSVVLSRNSTGASYPYTLANVVSITGNNYNTAYYYHYYQWEVSSACVSPRQTVTATVTPPPAITASGTSPICSGQQTNLSVTSGNSNYTYLWVPGNLAGASHTITPSHTTVYTVVASDNTTNCHNGTIVNVVVNSIPSAVTVTPATAYTGSITQLDASGGAVGGSTLSEGFETFPSTSFATSGTGVTASTNSTYYSGGSKSVYLSHLTATTGSYEQQFDMNMVGYSSAQLSFKHICGLEDAAIAYDLGYIEYSTDGGSSWTVFPASAYAGSGALITSQGDAPGTPVSGVIFSTRSYPDWISQFTSETATPGTGPATSLWKTETINIPSALLTSSQFRIRFKIVADPLTVYFGWLIDDVAITGTSNVTYTWSPQNNLWLDAGASVAYTGGATTTVWANPSSSVIYTATATNGFGCTSAGTATFEPNTKTLNGKVFLEGLYNTGTSMMNQANDHVGGITVPKFAAGIADVITVELHNASSPYGLAYEFSPIDLHTDGTFSVTDIPSTISGSYYIVIKHRNSIETWSKLPFNFSGADPFAYDFTTAINMAYGDNLKSMGTIWAIWAGDISVSGVQDGIVDGSDMLEVDNSSKPPALQGYYPQDINGDGIVDGSDMLIIDNNSKPPSVSVKKP